MLLKLFKYDFKKLSRVGVPCLIAILCIAVVGCINSYIFIDSINYSGFSITKGITGVFSFLGLFGTALSLSAVTTVITIIIYVRFYRSTATDEAYLTMTLPVTANQIILAKVFSAFLWIIITTVANLAAAGAIIASVFFSALPELTDTIPEIFSGAYNIFDIFKDMSPGFVVYIILTLLLTLVMTAENILQVFAAITVGSSLTKKYKGFASVAAILVANILVSSVVSLFSIWSTFNINMSYSPNLLFNGGTIASMNLCLIVEICVYIGLAVAFYLVCRHYLDKRVNLD